MRLVSLFSGAGISDVGFANAGFEHIAQVEIDKNATAVRRRHFKGDIHHEDVRGFSIKGPVDVVAGGFPCQDYSVAGMRSGLDGDRGALWWEFHRIVRESRPRFVVGENVPGILSSCGGRDFRTIVFSLTELGYRVAWRVLDLRYFGVPQRRRRVFIVASLGDGSAAEVLFEPESLRGDSAKGKGAGQDVAAVSGTLSANGGGKGGGSTSRNELDFLVANCLRASTPDSDPDIDTYVPVQCFNIRRDESRPGKENMSVTPIDQISSLTAVMPGENSHQSQTIIAQDVSVRRLTPRECERLMGLPDDFTRWGDDGREMSDAARYKMIGNGWAVPHAEWIARRIASL